MANDVALLELQEAARPDIPIILLPNASGINEQIGMNATVCGWGAVREGGYPSPIKRKVSVPLLSHEDCSRRYRNINTDMLCAGFPEGGKDACQGDSGA